jgi:hypothetical protein
VWGGREERCFFPRLAAVTYLVRRFDRVWLLPAKAATPTGTEQVSATAVTDQRIWRHFAIPSFRQGQDRGQVRAAAAESLVAGQRDGITLPYHRSQAMQDTVPEIIVLVKQTCTEPEQVDMDIGREAIEARWGWLRLLICCTNCPKTRNMRLKFKRIDK